MNITATGGAEAAASPTPGHAQGSLAKLAVGAIGIVFGDIGTSPIYAFRETFAGHHTLAPDQLHIYGVLSLIFWSMMIIVMIKYVSIIMRADNKGEGGSLALLALINRSTSSTKKWSGGIVMLGVFATALFYGDSMITPAISVLSAVEGLEVVSPHFRQFVLPLALLVLLALFALQKHGTAGIGKFFGPITLLWFTCLAILGIRQILGHPEILAALSPHHALSFIWRQPGVAFIILGAVVLCVTGAEALYADLGHFGKKPIRLAWFAVAMPALTLNYFGQGALLLAQPDAVQNPFFRMAPAWALLPLVLLATLAAVIASQALITGAFSVTRQVIQLGYLPRLEIRHTSAKAAGQIYIPLVNWSLFTAIALAVLLFRTSGNLAAAYGIAVTLDMLITTLLTFFVIRYRWHYPWLLCWAATGCFFLVDLAFFSSNLLKLFQGGWFPLAIGSGVFLLMMTWRRGRQLLHDRLQSESIALEGFLSSLALHPPQRVAGTAIFLSGEPGTVPSALLHNLKHNKVLHAQNLFVTVRNHEVPWVGMDRRLQAEALGGHCWQVTVHYGFKNEPDLPKALAQLSGLGYPLDPMGTSYFVSRDAVIPGMRQGMSPWREKLFAQMHRNASRVSDFLRLPSNSVVELGSKIEL